MFQLKIILASTRPGRKGPAVAAWIEKIAREYPSFEITMLDLKEINLPFLDEPHHPRLHKYTQEHTKRWSNIIADADAFIFVTAEYNYGYPATLKNALDFLYVEWNYKPAALVSYGGIAGGTRSVQQLKQVFSSLKIMPVTESVNIPFFAQYINDEEQFIANEIQIKAADEMMKELLRWTEALKPMRSQV